MRKISCAAILSLLCACSGGGGGEETPAPGAGTQPPGGNNPPPALTPQEIAQRILEDCAQGALAEFVGTIDLFRDIFATGQFPPTTLGIPNGNSVPFTMDVDDDGADDVQGTLTLEDGQGSPIAIDIAAIFAAGGFEQWLATLPAGTRLSADFLLLDGAGLAGNLTFTLNGGIAETVEGQGSLQLLGCSVDLGFAPVPLTALDGAFPNVVLNVRFENAQGVLDGTITMDGTQTGLIEVFLDGGQKFVFFLDLLTFAITAA